MSALDAFEFAGGSVAGREHSRAGRNNHDAFIITQTGTAIVGLVCDGCGSGKHSEVGAKLGVQLLSRWILHHASHCPMNATSPVSGEESGSQHPFWERVRQDFLAELRVIANSFGGSFSQTVDNYFMFTVVGALLTETGACVFSCGDGLFILNGELTRLGPFPGNQPPYLAYELTGSALTDENPELLKFRLHETVPVGEISSILLGTDGMEDFIAAEGRRLPGKDENVGPVSQFWTDGKFFTNPDMVRRRLFLTNRECTKIEGGRLVKGNGLLPDDTTLAVIRRKPEAG